MKFIKPLFIFFMFGLLSVGIFNFLILNSIKPQNIKQIPSITSNFNSRSISKINPSNLQMPASKFIQSITPAIKCQVYTYKDKFYGGDQFCIDKIYVQPVYFVPKDQNDIFQPKWSEASIDVLTNVSNFFENQFDNQMKIKTGTPILIYGDKNINEYIAAYPIAEETYKKISAKLPKNNKEFIDIQIFVATGANGIFGSNIYSGALFIKHLNSYAGGSVNPGGWLDPEGRGLVDNPTTGKQYYAYIVTAHEFGHSLGIPHPWEEEINKDSSGKIIDMQYMNEEKGSIMSYGGQAKTLSESFIRSSVKQKMMISYK